MRLASVLLVRISTIVELRSKKTLARREDEINQTLRLGLTLLNHQTRIATTTTTNKAFVQDERAHWQARGARLPVRLKTRDSGGEARQCIPDIYALTY